MNVGDYVRIINTLESYVEIIKIKELNENDGYLLDERNYQYSTDEIIKSSPNIKSVIEKDDFVNGERVNRVIPEDICGDELLDYQHIFVDDKEIYEEDIKSIVTHEQFSQMEYKVGE